VYRFYAWDPDGMQRGAGADLYTVEAEDDAVIERVARGVRSRMYRPGRLAPGQEDGVAALGDWVRARLL
jgi:choline monooxygenase